jgi:hypothetical protein
MKYQLDNKRLDLLSDDTKRMVIYAFTSLQKTELIDFFANYAPPATTGYMYDNNPIIHKIIDQIIIDYDGHSGSSLALTLLALKNYLIKN